MIDADVGRLSSNLGIEHNRRLESEQLFKPSEAMSSIRVAAPPRGEYVKWFSTNH
jgi:hypothetical protein